MNVNDERKRRIRERAYEIWERKGRPAGQQDQHWYEAERELGLANSQDEAGLEAARRSDNEVKRFEESEQVDIKAEEAREAIDGPDAEDLKQAERAGKERARVRR
jgi:hypothetical protein